MSIFGGPPASIDPVSEPSRVSACPDRGFQRFDKSFVPRQLFGAGGMGAGCAEFTAGRHEGGDLDHGLDMGCRKFEADLATAGEFDVNLGEKLGVEQRA